MMRIAISQLFEKFVGEFFFFFLISIGKKNFHQSTAIQSSEQKNLN